MRAQTARIGVWCGPAAVFDSLAGAWTFERRIDGIASMSGAAAFERSGTGRLAYREGGLLRLADGRSFQAERRYLFDRHADGFAVLFAEAPPRLFHAVALAIVSGRLAGDAEHLCLADRYRSRYEFSPDGTFSVRHIVSGPRKSYCSETVFRPAERAV